MVVQGPVEGTPVGEIQARLDIPGSTLSHHLSELTQADLLVAARQGTTIRYAAHFEHLRALTDYLWEDCCRAAAASPQCPVQGETMTTSNNPTHVVVAPEIRQHRRKKRQLLRPPVLLLRRRPR